MNKQNYVEEVLRKLTKQRLDEIGLNATEEQIDQLADFVNGLVLLGNYIQRDLIISKIQGMK